MKVWTACAIAVFAAGAAQAQVYKCVDASGKTVYSQNPCPGGAKSSTISRPAGPGTPGAAAKGDAGKSGEAAKAAAPMTPAEQEQAFRKRRIEQQEAQKKEAEKVTASREKEENCQRARTQLAQLEMGRVSQINSKGERYFLDEDQIASEKARAQAAVTRDCGK